MKKDDIAVFGSAFNPPHRGHEDVIAQTLVEFSRVILVPSFQHAFGKKMMPFAFRVKLVKAMVAEMDLGDAVEVSEVEKVLANSAGDGPIYTYDVMAALEASNNNDKHLQFVVGPDNANPETWNRFYRADEIVSRWGVWSAQERLHIRSSGIRDGLALGQLPSTHACCPSVIALLKAEFCL